jgi:hypothetical protein
MFATEENILKLSAQNYLQEQKEQNLNEKIILIQQSLSTI